MVPALRREVEARKEAMAQMEQEIQKLQAREQHLMATNESRMTQITDLTAELREKNKSAAVNEKDRNRLISQLDASKRETAEFRAMIRKKDSEISLLQGTREILQKKQTSIGRYYVAKINAKDNKIHLARKANDMYSALINQTKQDQTNFFKKLKDFLEVGLLAVVNSRVNELHLKTAQLLDTEERIKKINRAVVALRNHMQTKKALTAVTTPVTANINANDEAMDFESGTA
ncbi:hypothetical protein L3Y34_013706 [Caenorhabditis briggsae]|uniref:Uncharacterized protein n=1 Tax=Caenorhabditis briggsae TaxID=6238 RepID=A0AAE9CWL3_CAEBR|nr:hypothetical protein L3Y34_013706 [Caenorhabditis briggsae]